MGEDTKFWLMINRIVKLYEKMLKKVCDQYDLTLIETEVISFIKNNPGLDTAADIVELRMLSKGAVSKAVESLIGNSLLERMQDKADRRKMHLSLTEKAEPIMESIDKVHKELWEIMFDGFSEEELRLYGKYRNRLFENTGLALEERRK